MGKRQIIIIGSGPAGLTAGIYLSRAGYTPLIIEGVPSGGQLMITPEIENFPGFPEGISGPVLMDKIKKQALKFGAEFLTKNVTHADFKSYPFKIIAEEEEFLAQTVIIATGARAKYLDLPAVNALKGRGISACATCDGFFFKNKIVFVVGGGDTAAEEALYLAKMAKEVNIVHRRDKLRTGKYLQEKLLNTPNINIIWECVIEDIKDPVKKKVEKIVLKNVKTGEITEREANGIFMGIGHVPATDLFKGQITLDENGYIIALDQVKTNIKGVFTAGDVCDPSFRQAITAAGTGCMAAIEADRFLMES